MYDRNGVFGQYLNPWAEKIVTAVIPVKFIQELLIGPYGVITMALTYAIAIILPIILILLLIAILTGKLRIIRIKKQPAPQEKQPKKHIKEEKIIDAEYKMK